MTLRDDILCCSACRLRQSARAPVPGNSEVDQPVLFVLGEAPGKDEDVQGVGFIGKSGQELRALIRDHLYLDDRDCSYHNVVRCRPRNDRDPRPDEIEACRPWLEAELSARPTYILAVGAYACRALLGKDFSLERRHGVPTAESWTGAIVLPSYHPAYSMRDDTAFAKIVDDFTVFRRLMRGEITLRDAACGGPVSEPAEHYDYLRNAPDIIDEMLSLRCSTVAVDTEEGPDGPWCLTICSMPGESFMVMSDDREMLACVDRIVSRPDVTVLLHNALYDLPKLAQMGIHPACVEDTMVMAYLLQVEPLSLKDLADRVCGMSMNNYAEMLRPYAEVRVVEYFNRAVDLDIKAEPGTRRQSIVKKIGRALKDYEKNGVSLSDRWKTWPESERTEVEAQLGPFPVTYLCHLPETEALRYACRDADATLRIAAYLRRSLRLHGLDETFARDIGTLWFAVDVEQGGIQVNVDYLQSLKQDFEAKMRRLENEIKPLAFQSEINLASNDQVADLLFNRLRLRSGKQTKGGKRSTAKDVLETLVGQHPAVRKIVEWRMYAKLLSTYVEELPTLVHPDGRIRPNVRITATKTGRWSMSEPNLQNQPTRSDEGKKVRRAFTAREGCLLVSGDLSQIELRMAAHESQDAHMLSAFRQGQDIHAATASALFGKPESALDKDRERYPAKTINFGIFYGIGTAGLWRQLQLSGLSDWTYDRTAEFIAEWYRLYPGARAYQRRKELEAQRTGFVRDIFGRRYLCAQIRSIHEWVRAKALRLACNAPIQGGAQQILKQAMGDLREIVWVYQARGVCQPLIQIHDELLFEVSESLVDEFALVLKQRLENAVALSVPILSDIEVGPNWGQLEEWHAL